MLSPTTPRAHHELSCFSSLDQQHTGHLTQLPGTRSHFRTFLLSQWDAHYLCLNIILPLLSALYPLPPGGLLSFLSEVPRYRYPASGPSASAWIPSNLPFMELHKCHSLLEREVRVHHCLPKKAFQLYFKLSVIQFPQTTPPSSCVTLGGSHPNIFPVYWP